MKDFFYKLFSTIGILSITWLLNLIVPDDIKRYFIENRIHGLLLVISLIIGITILSILESNGWIIVANSNGTLVDQSGLDKRQGCYITFFKKNLVIINIKYILRKINYFTEVNHLSLNEI